MDDRLIRKIFSEIIASYSLAKLFDEVIFIKHFSSIDLLEFDFKYQNYLEYGKKRGLPTQKERLDLLRRDGLWNEGKEKLIKELKDDLSLSYETKRNYHSLRDISGINERIKASEDKLNEILIDKHQLIGECAETYARRKTDLDQVFFSFYKDSKLSILALNPHDNETISDDNLNHLILTYNKHNSELNDKNLKLVSVSNEFQSMFSMSENLYYFYGLPISKLTHYQMRLASYGSYFKNILGSSQRPPPDVMNDPDGLEDWFFARTNLQKLMDKNENEGTNTSIVGMTKAELGYLGFEVDNRNKSLRDDALANGGELSRDDMIRLGRL